MWRAFRLTLRQRLLLVAMLPAAAIALTVGLLHLASATRTLDESMHERGLAIVSFLAPASEYGLISGNHANLTPLLQAALAQPDVVAAAILGPDARIIAVSGPLQRADSAVLKDVPFARELARGQNRLGVAAPVVSTPVVIEDFGHATDPVRAGLGSVGWVYVELDATPLQERKREILLTTLSILTAGLAISAALAVRLARSVSKPLTRLVTAVREMAAGRLDVSVHGTASSDELRALETGFNQMARSIADAHHTLQARVDEATEKLAHQALHDPLTGLPNRRAFEQALEDAVAASRRAGDHAVLCFVDLDRFKIVNDTCGHAAGDELLRRIARLIRQRVRAEDLICRIGGDEFALILRGCSPDDARHLADGLRESISAFRFNWEHRRFTVGASIGLVSMDQSMESASDVLVAADMACYAAKKSGRNRVVVHHGTAEPAAQRGAVLPDEVATLSAIPFSQFCLYAQPVIPLTNEVAGGHWYEVLLRNDGDGMSEAAPAALLASLAENDAGLDLDAWVAELVCMTASSHLHGGIPAGSAFSLNLGRSSLLAATQYLGKLASFLRLHDIDPGRLVLEFPAQLAERFPAESRTFIRLAHDMGCRVALERLDGNAAGLLRTLQPDFAKVSLKTLVESYGMDAGCNLAQALCGMAAALSIRTIASEVEDELLYESLRGYGFDYAQGRIISSPAPLKH